MPQAPTTTVAPSTVSYTYLLFSSISTPSFKSMSLSLLILRSTPSPSIPPLENQETMTQNEELQGHVVVMAFPFGSHAAPLLNLVRRLAVLAPNVTFSFISTSNSNRTIFHSTSSTYESGLSNVKAYDVEDGIPEDHVPSRDPRVGMQFFLNSMAENFKKVIDEKLMEPKITCFLTDAFLWFAGDYAEEFVVPWISLWTAGPVSISSHFYTDLLRQTTALGEDGIVGREEEAITFIPGLQAIRLKDLPEGVITEPLGSPFSVMLHKMGQSLPRASAVIINSFEELDPPILDDLRSKFKKCLTVGPFTLTSPSASHLDADGCLSWLDKQTPTSVAYISFGTVTTPPPHELVALAEALEESGTPFLWSIKDHLKTQLPEGFLERTSDRGKVIPWAPQEKVLDHSAVGVFVTHCGWNSILESIISGVPMICRPFFGDQRLNARMVSDVWKIGTTINDGVFTKNGTMKGLDLILYTRDGLKMRENIGGIRGLAKHAVGPKGSSSEYFKTLFEIVCRK